MELYLLDVIKKFCKTFGEEYRSVREAGIIVVDNISEYVKQDDKEYYEKGKDNLATACGLFFQDSIGRWIIVIGKNCDELNYKITTIH